MKPGQVVFLFMGSDWRVARVISPTGALVEVEQVNGTRGSHGAARFARVSEKTVPTLAALAAYEDELTALIAGLDLLSLWSLLADAAGDTQPPPMRLSELSKLALPEAGPATDDAMAWALQRDGVHFESTPAGYVCRTRASVMQDAQKKATASDLARRLDAMVGWVRAAKAPLEEPLPPAGLEAIGVLTSLVLWEDERAESERGRSVLKRLGPRLPEGEGATAFAKLVELGVFQLDENVALRRSGLPTEFSPAVMAEAESCAQHGIAPDGRRDYRDLLTVAIDDPFTTEVDDAFAWVGGNSPQIVVFIADSAEWTPDGGALDAASAVRGATLYIPEGKLPMLPSGLSEDRASLVCGVDRYALAFVFDLNERGGIYSLSIHEAIVRVDHALTYREVDAILKGKDHPAKAMLSAVSVATEKLRVERHKAGALTVDRRDIGVHCTDGASALGRVVDVLAYRTDDPSRRLVAELMIQTSFQAAEFCRERGVPAVYRTQAPPEERPRFPEGRPLLAFELQGILKTMRRAELTTEPAPHAGLGLPCYTQVTSPLRRYADLLMHRQLKHVLRRGVPRYTATELMQFFERLDTVAALQRDVERESRRYWLLKHLEGRVGQRVKAEAVRMVGNKRWVVELVDFGVSALYAPPGRPPNPGDTLVLLLKAADARRDKVLVV